MKQILQTPLRPLLLLGSALLASNLTAQVPPLPPMPFPPENPITAEKAMLGKILFWDEQLSANNRVACATCHTPPSGGNDRRTGRHPGRDQVFNTPDDVQGSPGLPRANGTNFDLRDAIFGFQDQVTNRTAPTAIAAGYFNELFWDGRAGRTFRDPVTNQVLIQNGGALENQAAAPITNSVEMAHDGRMWSQVTDKLTKVAPLALASNLPSDIVAALNTNPSYPALFQAAFGDTAITAARIAFAIATYERTLVPNQSAWDRFNNGDQSALTANQLAGLNIFRGQGRCDNCHTPPLFSNQTFRFIGLRPPIEDLGRQIVTNIPQDAGRMKVPTLRNAALKTRFMHTGQFGSLAQVVGFYNAPPPPMPGRDPLIAPIGLNATQRGQLADFLTALVDPRVAASTGPFSRPTLYSETHAPGSSLYGAGSPGSNSFVPLMNADVPGSVGNTDFKISLRNALGDAPAALVLSAAPTTGTLFGNPLHVDLAGAFVLPQNLSAGGAGAGTSTQNLPMLVSASARGANLYGQWFVLDGAGQNGLAVSAGASWRAH